ncbi:tetratricopeptide repeat protein [Coralliovum pocilloporae]|uniref:tetratricopeptide repeat protein n=1 Tax=Coralliovum pocilloporae TaxID=3066369 RepID=UPI003307A6A6
MALRRSRLMLAAGLAGLMFCAPASAFDGSVDQSDGTESTRDAFMSGTRAYYSGRKDEAFKALQYAAEQGHAIAQWKIGKMYAEGDGVDEDDGKAFEYFSRIANAYAEDPPASPRSRFVANAFVQLGSYYMTGIQDSAIEPNVRRAQKFYSYAASYFGDADAQYRLARIYLSDSDNGRPKDLRMAARWLKLAAKKGHLRAQAELGDLLFHGVDGRRNPIRGLKWLTIARKSAKGSRHQDWIRERHEEAFSLSEEVIRRRAVELADDWLIAHRPDESDGPFSITFSVSE